MIKCSVPSNYFLGAPVRSALLVCEFCGKSEIFFINSPMRCWNCGAERFVNPLELIKNLNMRKKFFLGRN